jgi:hypothetical protein
MNFLLRTALVATLASSAVFASPPDHPQPGPDRKAAVDYSKLPMSFEPNCGQADPQVEFLARGNGYTLLLSPTEASLGLLSPPTPTSTNGRGPKNQLAPNGSSADVQVAVLRLQFLGANRSAPMEGLDEQRGASNYYVGNDRSKWLANVPHFARVRYHNLYPGIDVVYYGNQTQLEHDFVIAPGADPSAIRLKILGTRKITLAKNGTLLLSAPQGLLSFSKPYLYQQTATGSKTPVEGRYVRRGPHEVGFEVASYDHRQTLVIDPVLAYASLLGGDGGNGTKGDIANGVAADNAGNVYLTGTTLSANFPVKNAYQATCGGPLECGYLGSSDAFVTKIDTTQSGANSLIYSTYLGGNPTVTGLPIGCGGSSVANTNCVVLASGSDLGLAIAVDAAGDAYVAGQTGSFDFPIVGGIELYQPCALEFFPANGPPPSCTAGAAFVAKFSPSGALLYSTDLGGHIGAPDSLSYYGYDPPSVTPTGIAVDQNGIAYVAGFTSDSDFPITPDSLQYISTLSISQYAFGFLTKFDPTKTGSASMIYSTELLTSAPNGMALDSSADVYLAGSTSDSLLVTPGSFLPGVANLSTYGSGFIAKLDTTQAGNNAIVWGTFFPENISSIAVGSDGSSYVAGIDYGNTLAPTPGAFDICASAPAGDTVTTDCANAIFVTKLNPTGTALSYSARLGGSNPGFPSFFGGASLGAIAIDSRGNAYVTGTAMVSYVEPGAVALAPFPGDLIGNTCLANPNNSCDSAGAFVSMLNPQGSALVYSGLLTADPGDEDYPLTHGTSVAVDSAGDAYFAGYANSRLFPVTANAFQSVPGGYAGEAYVVKIAGTFPEAVLSTNSLSFGSNPIFSATLSQSVTLSNPGSGPLTISGISVTGVNSADFIISSNTCPVLPNTLALGGTCSVSVYFRPSIASLETATLGFTTNAVSAAATPTVVTLTGTGTASLLNITPDGTVTESGYLYSRVTRTYNFNMTFTNTSGATLTGPFQFLLTELAPGATLKNATGTYDGNPYITVPSVTSLAPGQSLTVALALTAPSSFVFYVYAGTF